MVSLSLQSVVVGGRRRRQPFCAVQSDTATTPQTVANSVRATAFAAAAALCLAFTPPQPAVAGASPVDERVAEFGVSRTGSLRSCPAAFNCVSTSSKTADQYAGPWAADARTPAEATDALRTAFLALYPTSEVAVYDTSPPTAPGSAYLRIRCPGRFTLPDEIEFLARFLPLPA